MSSAAIIILSSSAAVIQTRCFPSPALVAKDCWGCNTDGDRIHQPGASCKLQALRLQTVKADGFARRSRSTAVANAGLGRVSGAVHGSSQGKSRSRRRPPTSQDDWQEGDEHQDGKTGSDEPLTAQSQEEDSGESTAGAEECEAFAAAEGVIRDDESSDDSSQSLSYKRYLLELGVSPRSRAKDSESERDSTEFLRDLHGIQDKSPSDKGSHLFDEGNLEENEAISLAGSEGGERGDLWYEETKELDTERETDAERGRGKLTEKFDLVTRNEVNSKNGSILVEPSQVDGTVVPPPESNSSSLNEGEEEVCRNDGQNVDRIAEPENARELRSVSDGGSLKKKRRKKSMFKVVESSLRLEERGDNERVRASFGGAERPAMPSDKEFPTMNGSATDSNLARNFESELDFGTGVVPKEEANVESTSEFSQASEPADSDGQSSMALANMVDSNSTMDTTIEDRSQDTPLKVIGKVGSEVVETVLEQVVQSASKVVPVEIVEQAAQVASKVVDLPVVVVEQAAQVGGQVVEILPDVVTDKVGQVVDQVSDFAEQVSQVVDHVSDAANTVNDQVTEQVGQVVEQVSDFADQVSQVVVDHVSDAAEQVANTVNEQVEQVAESVSSTAFQVAEQVTNSVEAVTSTASQVVDQVTEFFTSDEDDDSDSDDEFEAYITSDLPEFRGKAGLDNFIVKQEDQGVLSKIYDIYTYMLKQSFPTFAAAMFFTPIFVSGIFTLLYLPEFDGLAFDDTARDFFAATGGDSLTLHISWKTIFQVFMFSLSLSTGLQPELAPLSPYTLIVANLNALVAQLVFVFLSGAVFARLSQPSQPLRCSTVALVSTSPAQRRRKEHGIKVFMARYVLAGPQPCELVDVKVDLTYKYNTLTRTGSFFRATQSLKLVRPEIAFLTHGMLVRHVIDETSPLYQRTPEMLNKEDAVFCLSVVGLERASMQSVFHVQHYCVVDNHVIWDAEFEDIILINKKNRRVVDHSRLSLWRPSLVDLCKYPSIDI